MSYDAPDMFEEGQRMAETLEERIRECAYHIWEASGRPSGRDAEFWQRACEMFVIDGDQPGPKMARRERKKQTQSAQPPRKRSRRTPPPASSGISVPAG
ncbi:MAG TPA: DUF2934 domain-containing protein [Acetobacteraceae bacterium]|jgi:hypothetical protein|nr:DUF2934 domain-containing protein [Acetobacteraceae bacterium]